VENYDLFFLSKRKQRGRLKSQKRQKKKKINFEWQVKSNGHINAYFYRGIVFPQIVWTIVFIGVYIFKDKDSRVRRACFE
jgi:hypothetical protein